MFLKLFLEEGEVLFMRIRIAWIVFIFSIRVIAGVNEDLLEAVKTGKRETVQASLTNGGDPNYRANQIKPLLSIAAQKGDIEIVRILLDNGASINAMENSKDAPGWTALMYAIEEGHVEVVKLLLDRKAKKNQKNQKGYDALYLSELCLLYTSPSPRDRTRSRMPSSA